MDKKTKYLVIFMLLLLPLSILAEEVTENNIVDNTVTNTATGITSIKVSTSSGEVAITGIASCLTGNTCTYTIPSTASTFSLEIAPSTVTVYKSWNQSSGEYSGLVDDLTNIEYNSGSNSSMVLYAVVEDNTYTINIVKESGSSSTEDTGGESGTTTNTVDTSAKLKSLTVGGVTVDLDECDVQESSTQLNITCAVVISSIYGYAITATTDTTKYKAIIDGLDSATTSSANGGQFGIRIYAAGASADANFLTWYTINVTGTEPEDEDNSSDDDSGDSSSDYGNTSGNVSSNADTGNTAIFIISAILILSFGLSLYVYRKNIMNYND